MKSIKKYCRQCGVEITSENEKKYFHKKKDKKYAYKSCRPCIRKADNKRYTRPEVKAKKREDQRRRRAGARLSKALAASITETVQGDTK